MAITKWWWKRLNLEKNSQIWLQCFDSHNLVFQTYSYWVICHVNTFVTWIGQCRWRTSQTSPLQLKIERYVELKEEIDFLFFLIIKIKIITTILDIKHALKCKTFCILARWDLISFLYFSKSCHGNAANDRKPGAAALWSREAVINLTAVFHGDGL